MSQPTPAPPSGISKSAAKKRAKKAVKAATQTVDDEAGVPEALDEGYAGEVPAPLPPHPHSHSHPHPHQHPHPGHFGTGHQQPLAPGPDPSLFSFQSGTYPEFSYEYDEHGALPTDPANPAAATSPFSLPFPFDYTTFGSAGAPNSFGQGINITHDDLFQTANELYKRMGDPNFGSDDAYWSSLPAHLRNFIREAVPFSGALPQGQPRGTVNEGQQGMWTMAQQIVSAASQGMGLGPGVSANVLAGINGRQYPQPGIGEELGFRRHPDAKEEEFEEEEEFDLDEPGYIASNGDAPKKKNKKKKKKSAAVVDPPPAQLPPPAVKQPPRQPIPPQPQPTLNPPPPPATPAPVHPPPSSRAAGKQPMTNPPANNPPARSARAAGKAPAGAAPPPSHNHSHHNHPPPKPAAKSKIQPNQPPAKIWTQSSAQDRENIRHFWLGLSEAERRDLLQIEKDAVLRKMKEQHRHSCGCAVCGRKKVNIESELDQLYEQYYDELRHYAAEQRAAAAGRHMPPAGAGPFPGSVEVDSTGAVTKFDHRAPTPHDPVGDEMLDDGSEEYDDEYDDEEDDLDEEDIESDGADIGDDMEDHHHTHPPSQPVPRITKPIPKSAPPRPEGGNDFMGFGNSLATIKGGILTVADDLLKNDGAKFLEMMEQLAVARSVREDQNIRDLQDETDDDYDDKDEPISEAERAEEGKRMFQIFAARMFEQRVLQAYREKVAKQREEQLLRELEEEDDAKKAKEEKKAKESQKKKDKKKAQKQRADEERTARDEALAAEAEAIKARAEQAERERHRKAEEERVRREAVKKAAAEEQARLAAERKKRQQEEKEREEEAARKKREREDKARREREAREKEAKEKEKRDREEKFAKEKADKERKAEKERLAREAKEAKDKAERERQAKLEEERVEKARKDEAARQEREAAEQAKVLAAQQAQRERAKAEKAAAEKADAAAAAAERAVRPVAPVPVRAKGSSSRNGPTPQTTPPFDNPSPLKSAPGTGRPPVRPQLKTPQPYFTQPLPVGSFPSRMSVPQSYAPGFRPTFPAPSPVFSPPQTGSNGGPSSISPNPPPRSFGAEPTPPYDLGSRSAPIGMGFPPVKSNRMASVDEAFSPPAAPIGMLSTSRTASGEVQDDFRQPSNPAPIGPPPGPIGRPSAFLDSAPSGSNSTIRTSSPAPPEQVFGSAALGGDDEIVQPARRHMSNGWDMPVGVGAAAPGAGRWSTSPAAAIWGTPASSAVDSASWAAPNRAPSFGMASPFAPTQPQGQHAQLPHAHQPPPGQSAFSNHLFSPPNHQSQLHALQPPHQHQHH